MQSFHASSSGDLLSTLRRNPAPTPPGERRTKEQSESWVIWHFLKAVAGSGRIEYPLNVEHKDRPDLVLSCGTGKTGIEITNAVPEDWKRAEAEKERITNPDDVPCVLFVPSFRIRDQKRSKDEIRKMARNQAQAQLRPHMGNSIERNWVEAMVCITEHKAGKFAAPGFAEHDKNWLLIHDNWSPGIHGCHEAAKSLARQLFSCKWRNPFEKIFILKGDGQSVWKFSRDVEKMKLHSPGHSRKCELTHNGTEP